MQEGRDIHGDMVLVLELESILELATKAVASLTRIGPEPSNPSAADDVQAKQVKVAGSHPVDTEVAFSTRY